MEFFPCPTPVAAELAHPPPSPLSLTRTVDASGESGPASPLSARVTPTLPGARKRLPIFLAASPLPFPRPPSLSSHALCSARCLACALHGMLCVQQLSPEPTVPTR